MVRKGTEKPEGGADKILVLWRRGRQGETRVGKGLSRDLRQSRLPFRSALFSSVRGGR